MSWLKILEIFAWLIGQVKDTDKDGVIDLLDKEPQNPEVQ